MTPRWTKKPIRTSMATHPSAIRLLDGTSLLPGKDDVDYLEELTQPGPGGPVTYIRLHFTPAGGGGYADFPKHNLTAVWYCATQITSAPTFKP